MNQQEAGIANITTKTKRKPYLNAEWEHISCSQPYNAQLLISINQQLESKFPKTNLHRKKRKKKTRTRTTKTEILIESMKNGGEGRREGGLNLRSAMVLRWAQGEEAEWEKNENEEEDEGEEGWDA